MIISHLDENKTKEMKNNEETNSIFESL